MGLSNPTLRATPTGVAIRGAIPVTAKMAPKSQKLSLQWRWYQRWQNVIRDFGVPYLATLERYLRRCKIAVDGSYASQQLSTAIFYFNFYKNTEIQRGNELTLNPYLRNLRPCLVGRKFSVFSIQTFRKQGKHVYLRESDKNKF